jgi:hypothetical protein
MAGHTPRGTMLVLESTPPLPATALMVSAAQLRESES